MTVELVKDFPHPLMFDKKAPCISIYLPTHLHTMELKSDRILYKNLVRECESVLNLNYGEEEAQKVLSELIELEKDDDFWRDPTEGLALFRDAQHCIVYKLQSPVEALAIVSDSFHLKPLIKYFQFAQKVQILGISAENFRLFEGNRYGFNQIKLDDAIPTTLEETIGIHKAESYLSKGSYGGINAGMYHGQGGRKDEHEKSTEKFFRTIDKTVYENCSRESKCPLILLALSEYHSVFMGLSNNPYLMKEGIKGDPESFDLKLLCEKYNEMLKPRIKQKLQDKFDRYQAALSESLSSDRLSDITKAALDGRIETLLIEENRIIPGKINQRNQKIDFGDPETMLLDDVLDDLAEQVLKSKGEVLLFPKTEPESKYGVKAIFRY